MKSPKKSVVVRFDTVCSQDKYRLNRLSGMMLASSFYDLIDEFLNEDYNESDEMDLLEANPRDPKKSAVTKEIVFTLQTTPSLFPFMSKGVLIAANGCTALERNRFELAFEDPAINGILDGGHNSLAIALYILERHGASKTDLAKIKRWTDLAAAWAELANLDKDEKRDLDFLVPVEIIYPKPTNEGYRDFRSSVLEIARARNNNAQLTDETKANKAGYFDYLKDVIDPEVAKLVEWKTNDGGKIKVRELIALSIIPLTMLPEGKFANPVAIYSYKSKCMEMYEQIVDQVEGITGAWASIKNERLMSALQMMNILPELYDLIDELLPDAYNKGYGGKFGRLNAVKWNDGKIVGKTKFYGHEVQYGCPDGFLMPLVYGFKALMTLDSKGCVEWSVDPKKFVKEHLEQILSSYGGNIEMAGYDPQVVGKNKASYTNAFNAFEIALMRSNRD